MKSLIDLRRDLHRRPEVSNEEAATAKRIVDFLRERAEPHDLIEGLGGHGVAATYVGPEDGPTVMVRCELDGLPIRESGEIEHRSENRGAGHQCGHDGHMVIVTGLGTILRDRPPARGRVVLLYQPAEETGEGARRVLEDVRFPSIQPDRVFALHNLPGFERGRVLIKGGVFASASRGMITELHGAPSHAGQPGHGRNPAIAAAQIVQSLVALPTMYTELHESAAVTPIYINVGKLAFGTSAGEGVVGATLRAHEDEVMAALAAHAERIARALAAAHELAADVAWTEIFEAVVNDESSVELVASVAEELGLDVRRVPRPFPWSEDFGVFTSKYPGAMFGLGSGTEHPPLHSRNYDFPDDLIETGVQFFDGIIRRILGG